MLGYSAEEMRQLYVWDWEADMTREQVLGGRTSRALRKLSRHTIGARTEPWWMSKSA